LYSAAYSLATIGIFAVLIKLKDYSFEGFNAFARQQPVLAAATTIFLLSLAGIPLTAGFLSKFWMLKAAAVTGKYFWLVIFAVLMAVVSVYYYFRVIQAMYFKEGEGQIIEVGIGFKWTLVVLAGIIILLGIFPNLIIYWLYF
jgi:NADH-quinone oxidoreductase subunit N